MTHTERRSAQHQKQIRGEIMNIIRGLITVVALFSLAVPATPSLAATKKAAKVPAKERVVIQVSEGDPKKWALALNVATNVQKDLGADKVQVELVAFGPGIGMLKADAEIATRVGDVIGSGVEVSACANSMRLQKIEEADLTDKVTVVPAGAVQIIKRQREGWAYLRP